MTEYLVGLDPEWQQGAAEEWGVWIPALKHDPMAALNALDAVSEIARKLRESGRCHEQEECGVICAQMWTLAENRDKWCDWCKAAQEYDRADRS